MYILEISTWSGSEWGNWNAIAKSDDIEELKKRINDYVERFEYNFRVRIITIIMDEMSY